jgi:phosphotransferase system HPr (HPr) family protein
LTKHLHARPAGQVAVLSSRHPGTTIELAAGGRRVNARSVLAVMGLGAVSGNQLQVIVAGDNAAAVADEIIDSLDEPDPDE